MRCTAVQVRNRGRVRYPKAYAMALPFGVSALLALYAGDMPPADWRSPGVLYTLLGSALCSLAVLLWYPRNGVLRGKLLGE